MIFSGSLHLHFASSVHFGDASFETRSLMKLETLAVHAGRGRRTRHERRHPIHHALDHL